jgi:hypothetical protein
MAVASGGGVAPARKEADERPVVTSYDSGYEFSVERWFETRREVEEAALQDSPLDRRFS